MNIFEKLNNIVERLNNPSRNYWESTHATWDREAKMPNNETFDEKQMYEQIRQSDINRLLRFG